MTFDTAIFDKFADQGVMGLVILALGYVSWSMYKRQTAIEDAMRKRVDELQSKMEEYMTKDRVEMKSSIDRNTMAMEKFFQLMEEMKEEDR